MSKKTLSRVIVSLMATVILLGVFLLPSSAATTLKNATVTLNATTFTYTGKAIKPTVTVKLNKKTVNAKNYTVSYKNNKAVGKGTVTVKGKGSYTGSVSKSFYIRPQKVTSLKATSYPKQIKLSWGGVTGATGYQVYQYKNGAWTKIKTLTAKSYTISSLSSATTYKFCVRAYAKVGNKYLYSPSFTFINATTTISKVTNLALESVTKDTAKIKWSKVAAATSYKIYLVNEQTGAAKAYNTTKLSYTLTSLTGDTQYKVKVRAYNEQKDITGSYCSYLYFNTAPSNVTGFTASANGSNVVLSWNKVAGASGYEIQMCSVDSLGGEGEYTKIATTYALSYTMSGLKPYQSYCFRIRAYSTGDVTAYGDFVKSSRVETSLLRPGSLSSFDVSNTSASISWNASVGASGYKLYVDGKFFDIIDNNNTTVYTAEELKENTKYTFGVSAYYMGSDMVIHESDISTITVTTSDSSVSRVEFSSKPTSMSVGETYTLSVRVLPEYAENKAVTYKSSNTTVATVDSYGTITALTPGTTTITATSVAGNKSVSFSLTVKNITLSSISMPSNITVYLNEMTMIVPTFNPSGISNVSYTVTGTDYTYTYSTGIGIFTSTKTDTCKFSDYIYLTSDGIIKGLKVTTEPETDKEFAFTLTVSASGKTATTKVTVKERKMKLTYSGDDSPWYYGNSAQLSVELGVSISSKYTLESIRYKSSDTKIATVNSKGVVSCVGGGKVTITAYTSDNAYSDSYEIYVRSVVTATKSYFESCKIGSTYQINASLIPNGTNDTLIYQLADPATTVISLNSTTGEVKFLSEGSAAVIVSSKSGMANTKQIWFTSKTSTVPSNSLSKAALISTIKDKADSVKSADYLPGFYRTDATTFDGFTLSNQSTSGLLVIGGNQINEDTFMSTLADMSAPRSSQQAAGGDWQAFNTNVPVSGQMVTILDGLETSDVKSIKVVDDGSYTYDIVMTLESEYFSSLPTNSVRTAHGKVFDILTDAYLSDAISEFNSSGEVTIKYSNFTQRYHDCTLTVTVNKITGNVTSMKYDMSVDVNIKSFKMEMSAGKYEADMSFSCNNVVAINFYGYKD